MTEIKTLMDERDTELLRASHVRKTFESEKGTELTVLKDMNFVLREGEVVALLGRSGAGKSTFLRVLAGLVPANDGWVKYRGRTLTGPNPGVGFVFQTFALLPWLTVQQNVELGLEARGIPAKEREQAALEAIDAIGLDGFENAYPKELSGGMRQRVGIARAMVLAPDMLFMDEPFSALDVLTAENLRREVLSLWSENRRSVRSILIVTHNIEEAVEMADRVIVLGSHPGRIVHERVVDLPRPRDRHSEAFEEIVDELYEALTGQVAPARPARARVDGAAEPRAFAVSAGLEHSAPAVAESDADVRPAAPQAGVAHPAADALAIGGDAPRDHLPDATPGDLAGFMDMASEYADGVDLADLAERLSFEVDDLFPLVDAAKQLGMIVDPRGHVRLTTLGERWVAADMQGRKELFADMTRARIPLVRSIDRALKTAHGKPIDADLVLDLLEASRSSEDARREFDTAVSWGRYAELFDYDAAANMLELDPANVA